jgi:hypothetical protein
VSHFIEPPRDLRIPHNKALSPRTILCPIEKQLEEKLHISLPKRICAGIRMRSYKRRSCDNLIPFEDRMPCHCYTVTFFENAS